MEIRPKPVYVQKEKNVSVALFENMKQGKKYLNASISICFADNENRRQSKRFNVTEREITPLLAVLDRTQKYIDMDKYSGFTGADVLVAGAQETAA